MDGYNIFIKAVLCLVGLFFDLIYITKRGGQGRENEKVISVSGILYLNDTMVFTTPILFTF